MNPLQPKQNVTTFIIVLLVIIVLGMGAFFVSNRNDSPTQPKQAVSLSSTPVPTDTTAASYPHALVYGMWTTTGSVIKAYDMQANKPYLLAELPSTIKKVTFLPPDTLLYINNTDADDHGSEIVSYSLKTKQITPIVKAETGFGIDEYQLSPNGQYMSVWEVQFAPNTSVLYGGKSRLYTIAVANPTQKNLIYDEVVDKPIHYARAILNDGRVFSDTFLPNSVAGWAHGMSVSDFSGANKKDIPSMTNGTYGRQPVLSPDGNTLAFAGYDGTRGSGTELVNGVRRAIQAPNTVELLDTTTLTRKKLANLPNSTVYDQVTFDKQSNELFISHVLIQPSTTELLQYDLATTNVQKVPNSTNKVFVSTLSPNMLLGTPSTSNTTMGNLGSTYRYAITNYSVFDPATSQTTSLPATDSFMQTITLVPSSSLDTTQLVDLSKDDEGKGLQLKTFALKPELQKERAAQQNNLPSNLLPSGTSLDSLLSMAPNGDLAALISAMPSGSSGNYNYSGGSGSSYPPSYDESLGDCKPAIYLYPKTTQDVTVKLLLKGILTYTLPFYPTEGWQVSAEPSGKLTTKNGMTYDYLYYEAKIPDSYFENADFQKKGYVVAYTELPQFFDTTLPKMGLSTKESSEFKEYWMKALPQSAYYQVSVVPHSLLDSFAKLLITPKPDTTIRVTLHFKPLDKKISLPQPQLSAPQSRNGFTVVEWAGTMKADKDHPFTCLM